MNTLIINAGSSSYKCTLYELDSGTANLAEPGIPLWEAMLDLTHTADTIELQIRAGKATTQQKFQSREKK